MNQPTEQISKKQNGIIANICKSGCGRMTTQYREYTMTQYTTQRQITFKYFVCTVCDKYTDEASY